MFRQWLLALTVAGTLTHGVAHAPQPTLVFTATADEACLVDRFTQHAKYFDASVRVPVKYPPVKSYPAAVNAFTNNQVQFAWFGGLIEYKRGLPSYLRSNFARRQGA